MVIGYISLGCTPMCSPEFPYAAFELNSPSNTFRLKCNHFYCMIFCLYFSIIITIYLLLLAVKMPMAENSDLK